MIPSQSWTKMPNHWIEDKRLIEFKWTHGNGSNELAALLVLTVLLQFMNKDDGTVRITYEQLCNAASMSRKKISEGLKILLKRSLISITGKGRYSICDYNAGEGWAKFPAKRMYGVSGIRAFKAFTLRNRGELDAMKLFFLYASRRDRKTNMAKISFDKITEYTDIPRNNIKTGNSILAANGLVHMEQVPSVLNDYGIANAYRLAHIDSYIHMGTRGRAMDRYDFDSEENF